MTLIEIRRRPTLPGRFQPSTISVLRLNFCVRDGNRWIPQAIVTGNQTGFGSSRCRASSPRRFGRRMASRLRGKGSACNSRFRTLKTAQVGFLVAPDQGTPFFHDILSQILSLRLDCLRFVSSAFVPFRFLKLPSTPLSTLHSLSRSSPRPISITKLHVLPHFHR